MSTVLLTGVGGAAGIGAIRALTQTTDHQIVGVDMDPDAAGLHLVDRAARVPAAREDDWAETVATLSDRYGVDVIVPTVDEELLNLPELVELVPDTPIIAPSYATIVLSLDKYQLSQYLSNAGHTVPQTWLGSDHGDVPQESYPLIGKPRAGRGSRGVTRLHTPEETERYLANQPDLTEVVLQELIEGTEFTTSVVATEDGRLLSVVPKEALEKRGSTVRGATREAPAVVSSCESIWETLRPRGPINVQQIRDEEGAVYTIEVNPRFSSTACLTVAAGVDELDLLIRSALGETVDAPPEYTRDLHIIRYRDHVFAEEAAISTLQSGKRPGQ